MYKASMARTTGILGALGVFTAMAAVSAHAALCVWLNPERDIAAFFRGADGYTTETRRHTREQRRLIERRLGGPLDPDEVEFNFYRVRERGRMVGTVLTHQARGRYGAVQVVVALNKEGAVRGVRVQRDREPVNLNEAGFLKQFEGKTARDPVQMGKDIKPIAGHERSSDAVISSVRKLLVVHDVLEGRETGE